MVGEGDKMGRNRQRLLPESQQHSKDEMNDGAHVKRNSIKGGAEVE